MNDTQHTPLTAEELEALRNTLISQSHAPTVSIGPKAESEIQMLRKQRDALLAACEGVAGFNLDNFDLQKWQTALGVVDDAIALAKPKGGE